MVATEQARIAPARVSHDLQLADLRAALAAGWRDYRAHPGYGLFFAGIHVVSGLLIGFVLVTRGELSWLASAAAGFPILAPFAAVGLYEVSRRRELGLPLGWGVVLGAVRGRGDEQILSMGVILFVAFAFWLMVAHGIFAVFMADAAVGGDLLAALGTRAGAMMLAFGGGVGALMALGFYAITVMSLPMLVDREVDFITAIIMSLATVRANPAVMLGWAVVIAVLLVVAMLPLLLGLFVVLPVLGHATWHLYRRVVR
ncbi:putative membrane protein [Polymorphobacter multimanifer]|uniref:Putative membrane protein n=1 Tax=Polymorphobacter multimanifer TaxID=1070431 RepID=A0A841L5K6_9SPHN|nr:DUF2189 domain-containing protein [Polymorphobacter multimanifer]MBB6227884.1 putative membrane protein [Polymorphobacter multimanifer]